MHVCIRGCEGSRKVSLPFSTPEEEWDRISWQETANERNVVECRLRSRKQRRRRHSSRRPSHEPEAKQAPVQESEAASAPQRPRKRGQGESYTDIPNSQVCNLSDAT